MSDDRTLLERAARAAGYNINGWVRDGNGVEVAEIQDGRRFNSLHENQLTDCMGDALRLVAKLRIDIGWVCEQIAANACCEIGGDAATCRAITRAAAAMAGEDAR